MGNGAKSEPKWSQSEPNGAETSQGPPKWSRGAEVSIFNGFVMGFDIFFGVFLMIFEGFSGWISERVQNEGTLFYCSRLVRKCFLFFHHFPSFFFRHRFGSRF